jgi:hypothetical protein
MRMFRWLAAGCVMAAVGVAAFAFGVWVTRPAPPATTSAPTPGHILWTKGDAAPADPPRVIRAVNHQSPPGPVHVPDLPSVLALHKPAEPRTRYLNKPVLEFDYEVTKQGKSGVKTVVVYAQPLATPIHDGTPSPFGPLGRGAWSVVAKSELGTPAERPKLAYTMPKEGGYGFLLGVSKGSVTAAPPQPTDEPELVVVFDKTPPVIEKFEVTPVGGPNDGMNIVWKVVDAQSGDATVTLEYQTSHTARWQLVVERTGNNSPVMWTIPADAPAAVNVRLTVTDLAGNTTQKVLEAVNTDHTVPQGRLTAVKATDPPKEPDPLPPRPAFGPDLPPAASK